MNQYSIIVSVNEKKGKAALGVFRCSTVFAVQWTEVLSLEVVSLGSQICRLCRDDVTKVLYKSTYTPRWERK